ncbi:superoxide dismutase [Parvularcula sp. LCG005]|uniref:superoxide dismutase n=1 Tax=Parvularcula sp. LCG005 TaxID=3078805 RepID=UPI002943C9B5|nr:superoxide dismutase [Parvularcula sp. LCG005]WOI53635.1 superoxide dismutase [Parvularcula sp. LCG005]
MAVELPALPYARDALEPHVSKETLDYHYGKHHQAYVDNLNGLIKDTDLDSKPLEEIILHADKEGKAGIFNNAAQVWNHTFYWNSMTPSSGGGAPKAGSKLAAAIDEAFGSYDKFKDEFATAGKTQFGSGWAWLVAKGGKLEVRKTANAETPLTEAGVTPLLTMDVWEHAYYLDYQNARPKYIEHWLENLANWDFAEQNFEAA